MTAPAHPYSLVRETTGQPAYVSGVLPYRPDGSLAEERHEAIGATLSTLRSRLEAVGSGMHEVVKVTVFLTDIGWLGDLNAAWADAFEEPRPARSAVQVSALPRGAVMEIEAVLDRPLPSS